MRRVVLSVVVAAATAVAVTAGAAPSGTGRFASADLVFSAHGVTKTYEFRAGEVSGRSFLIVQTTRCYDAGPCDEVGYSGPLPVGALTIDPSSAEADLQLTIAGRALHMHWTPGDGTTVGGGDFYGQGTDSTATQYAGSSAAVATTLDAFACRGSGGVGTGVVVSTGDVSGGDGTLPLSRLRLPRNVAPSCDVPSDSLLPDSP